MRARHVRFGRPTTNADNGYRFLVAVAITQRNRSVEAQLDLKAYGILPSDHSRYGIERHSLPSENDVVLILDHVNIVTVAFVSGEIVPQAGDHAGSIHPLF